MRVFLDTNILLDTILERSDASWRDNASTILQLGKNGDIELYISILSIPTVAYVLKNISADSKKSIIKGLTGLTTVLPALPDHIQHILDGTMSDIEDALQVQSAREGQCELILTRNTADFKDSDIPALSPDEFLQRVLIQ